MHRAEWKSNEGRSVNCVVRWYFNFGVSSSIEKKVLEDDVGVHRYWGCRGSLVAVLLRPDVVCGWNYPEETHMHGGVSDCAESCADQQKQWEVRVGAPGAETNDASRTSFYSSTASRGACTGAANMRKQSLNLLQSEVGAAVCSKR